MQVAQPASSATPPAGQETGAQPAAPAAVTRSGASSAAAPPAATQPITTEYIQNVRAADDSHFCVCLSSVMVKHGPGAAVVWLSSLQCDAMQALLQNEKTIRAILENANAGRMQAVVE